MFKTVSSSAIYDYNDLASINRFYDPQKNYLVFNIKINYCCLGEQDWRLYSEQWPGQPRQNMGLEV